MENKTGKYFKYAIGEIVLVVIGILIALSINNWNENRKNYAKTKNYITAIESDLKKDTIRFNDGVANLINLNKDEEWVLSTLDYKDEDVNRIVDCIYGWSMDYYINDRTFEKIQNKGDSKLVGFNLLSERINTYYTTLKARTESFTDWDDEEIAAQEFYLRNLYEKLELSNYQIKGQISLKDVKSEFPMRQDSLSYAHTVLEFANSIRGRNHFKNNYIRHVRIKDAFENVINEATQLLTEIKQELDEYRKHNNT